jgi:hypothetical protein
VPALASLREEDLWAPEPAEETGGEADDARAASPTPAAPGPQDTQAVPEWAPFDTGSVPVVGDVAPPPPPPQPNVPIPPVAAAELSFWDLFPEDLPPARPAAFPAEDVVEHLALPEGPDSAAERLASADPGSAPTEPAPAEPPPAPAFAEVDPLHVASPDDRAARPPDAEIVIAELLDGPLPTGPRLSAESQWAPPPEEDIFINDLLVRPPAGPGGEAPGDDDEANDDAEAEADDLAAATRQRTPSDQARIAADRARRRRSRRSGGRGNPPGSG